ncbi:ankyrin repeat domain-containing protein [Herbidospora yilanensis]|uniref:ankyrin repeat domain-containing protein n=1 Tax=Herbidospora yilanensis TaxID=354426 RepID=UPI000B2EEBF3|nr:ankyrin repeat domain-containing protein [Herbidospora yilanensis]
MTISELMLAVAHDDLERAHAALRREPDLNRGRGTLPLYRAAQRGNAAMVTLLLEHGADPNQASHGEEEGLPLCAAACWNHEEALRALLEGGADPDLTECDEWTPLMWAATLGHLETADLLLDFGADPDLCSPLVAAARFGAYGVVWSLLEHGATPLHEALEVARALAARDLTELAEGCDPPAEVSLAADGTTLVSTPSPEGREISQRGHAAIATLLEDALGERPPVEELMRRAVPYRDVDEDGETWWAAVHAIQRRADDETFSAAVALVDRDDPMERDFGVDVLSQFGFTAGTRPYLDRTLPVLRDLAEREEDPRVIDSILRALGQQGDPRALPDVLALIERPGRVHTMRDPVALSAVLPGEDKDGLAALITLSRDPSADVRDYATFGLAALDADNGDLRAALLDRLTDPDLVTAAEATRGLAMRGDDRAVRGVHRVLSESDDVYARDVALQAAGALGLDL